jgi:YidC/Oxa1 family membrane protein insertase
MPAWLGPALLVVVVLLVVAACFPAATPAPGSTPTPTPVPTTNPAAIPLAPATPNNPFGIIAWLFTPIFQLLFIILVVFEQITNNIAIAIVLLTVLIKIVLIPVFRLQTVSMRRTQMLAPELKELQKRYKGDAVKMRQAQQEFYRERGVNPLSGCLPMLVQLVLLFPMYSVFSSALANYNPQEMLTVFGVTLIDLNCPAQPTYDAVTGHVIPCINPVAFGINWSQPLITVHIAGFALSALGVVAGLLTFLQSRMTMAAPGTPGYDPNDQNTRIQRQMAVFFPFIYVFLGGTWPAGLLLYIMVSTIFTIVQQYLIIGWGGMFPLFGWTPGFARDHTPRFPVVLPPPVEPSKRTATSALGGPAESRAVAADKTIRHRERGRQSRRGRRR